MHGNSCRIDWILALRLTRLHRGDVLWSFARAIATAPTFTLRSDADVESRNAIYSIRVGLRPACGSADRVGSKELRILELGRGSRFGISSAIGGFRSDGVVTYKIEEFESGEGTSRAVWNARLVCTQEHILRLE